MFKFDVDKGNSAPIPIHTPTFEEISVQMRINCDILKREISDHVDDEIKRFKKEINE